MLSLPDDSTTKLEVGNSNEGLLDFKVDLLVRVFVLMNVFVHFAIVCNCTYIRTYCQFSHFQPSFNWLISLFNVSSKTNTDNNCKV